MYSFESDTSHSFFFPDTATPQIYTLSLHDALPIFTTVRNGCTSCKWRRRTIAASTVFSGFLPGAITSPSFPRTLAGGRSEEHTSELQSPYDLVCRLLLEKKKKKRTQAVVGRSRRGL